MAAKYRLQDIYQLRDRNIFVDANVLIYLFWPSGSYLWEQHYARAMRNIIKQGNSLFIDFFVISEIINRVLRIEHAKLQPHTKFKDFRDSQEGKDALADIYLIVKHDILSRFTIVGKIYNKQEFENLLVVDELDFVDKSTVKICKENSLVLLTNDKDFKNTDLEILTGNPNIFN
jgi:predicted nucleic acid-binding protein